jgi:hypothetical protein
VCDIDAFARGIHKSQEMCCREGLGIKVAFPSHVELQSSLSMSILGDT